MAAGAVDIDEADVDNETTFKKQGYNDMGDTSKFTVTENDKIVAMCKRLFSHDVRSVCVAVSNSQWRGYFPDSKAGVETSVFDILANYVYMHTQIQSQDARIAAQRGRETQKAQARLPPTALYMHSCNALLRKNIRNMTWSTDDANTLLDIVSQFQEWSGLKISIKKSLATGALYGRGETQRQKEASAEPRKRKAPGS